MGELLRGLGAAQLREIASRLDWLKQKEAAMREPGNADYTPSDLLRGRVQGQIGELELILKSNKGRAA